MKRKTALITGASSGIGEELAYVFAREGYDVLLVARNASRLSELADVIHKKYTVNAIAIPMDLAVPTAPSELFRIVNEKNMEVNVLVNNAGYATFGEFVNTDIEAELSMIQLNVVSLTHLTKLFLSSMVQRNEGRILNVASTAAFQPGPLMAVYYATKAYVLSFSEAIAEELQETQVTVTALCPGPTESGFQVRAQMEKSKLVHGKKIMTSRQVAEAAFRAVVQGKRIEIPGFKNRIMAQSVRFTPRKLVTRIVKKLSESV